MAFIRPRYNQIDRLRPDQYLRQTTPKDGLNKGLHRAGAGWFQWCKTICHVLSLVAAFYCSLGPAVGPSRHIIVSFSFLP